MAPKGSRKARKHEARRSAIAHRPSATPPSIAAAKDAGPAKCYLTNIPIEVLLRITHNLTTTELGNVRLTCRALEQSLFHFFSHEFFRKKQFMVSDFSLQTLVDISNHPTLSKVLTHVIIATDYVTSYVHTAPIPSKQDALTDYRTAFEWLVSAGLMKEMLTEAFRNLVNLEIVDVRDFNAKSRNRDGTGTEWRSYGSKTLGEAIGSYVIIGKNGNDLDPSIIFRNILGALGAAASSPKAIEVNLRSAWCIDDPSFFIHPRLEAALVPVLEGLNKLHLVVNTAEAKCLADFLSKTPNITWLRINAPASRNRPHHDHRLFDWLARISPSPGAPSLGDPVQLPLLEKLDLGNVQLSPKLAVRVITHFAASLRSLSLRRVVLMETPADSDTDDDKGPWVEFFNDLGRAPGLDIREFELSLLGVWTTEGYDDVQIGGGDLNVVFGPDKAPHLYKGDTMRVLISKIQADLAAGKEMLEGLQGTIHTLDTSEAGSSDDSDVSEDSETDSLISTDDGSDDGDIEMDLHAAMALSSFFPPGHPNNPWPGVWTDDSHSESDSEIDSDMDY
ncbi:hypothetical protein QBC34DRAFT_403352 [Podospora aff. communis PSN243]|uniref:F-box domain-containing protein n=1 Tax=Podospora aff. communis PSN243 TaxID=3040156 RepID=A0AAV9GNI6_9PEZI|nr:hypothetical protein QBC34DRAFT_403352 [Podospora aff. communis PSN243]